jgi:5-methyltetrahydrofolate--homocysteine methyltransferase
MFAEMVIDGNVEGIKGLTEQVLHEGAMAHTILEEGLLPGMNVVGRRFKAGDMFIPEVLLSASTMNAAMELLRPLLSASEAAPVGTIVIGTVEGDIHNIGKNLVTMLLEGARFKVVDLGVDIAPRAFVEAAKEHKPDILAMSALLTTTVPKMAETINALHEAGIRNHLKIMVGGAPVTQEFADKIGADGYASNAATAAEKARALLGE